MNKHTAALLQQHFDTAFNAPNGIQKLRELILTLAMQGKLVTQDLSDPPASDLLKDIEAEKKRLVKEGKIKAPKPLPPVAEEEKPYALPQGWEWVRFGNLAKHNSGKTLDKGRNTGLLRDYITTSNLYWGRFELETVRQMLIRDEELEKCTARKNDLLICEGGEAGRAAVWKYESEVCFQNHIHRARFYGNVDPYFAYRFFEKLNSTGEIRQHRKGVGISNMSSAALASILFPLPPLPEQHRIVAKIDELMARCDALEKLRTAQNEKRLTVHAAAMGQLLNITEPAQHQSAQAFLADHFGDLYTVKANVAELRKAILQLAVMGKLVPQNPNDPPASELLKEIEAEKKRLVKEGKIKTPKPLPPVAEEEKPYAVPQGWEWVRLDSVSEIIGGYAYKSNLFKDVGRHQVLRLGNIRPNLTRSEENPVYIDDDLADQTKAFEILQEDILITMTGTREKRDYLYTALVELNSFGGKLFYLNQRVAAIRTYGIAKYIDKALKVEILKDIVFSTATGSANQANIGISALREWALPLPPLLEQNRIVAKINKLMALCDSLDRQIDAATDKQNKMLDAVMAQI